METNMIPVQGRAIIKRIDTQIKSASGLFMQSPTATASSSTCWSKVIHAAGMESWNNADIFHFKSDMVAIDDIFCVINLDRILVLKPAPVEQVLPE